MPVPFSAWVTPTPRWAERVLPLRATVEMVETYWVTAATDTPVATVATLAKWATVAMVELVLPERSEASA